MPPNLLNEMINRLARLETFTGVDDHEGGLRREINELRSDVRHLMRTVNGINYRIYFAMGGCAVIGGIFEYVLKK